MPILEILGDGLNTLKFSLIIGNHMGTYWSEERTKTLENNPKPAINHLKQAKTI